MSKSNGAPDTNLVRIPMFVYGTLKRGHGNWSRLLQGSTCRGAAVSLDTNYAMVAGGFPIVWEVEKDKGAALKGELFWVDEQTLARCDSIEGHPRMYRRQEREFYFLPRLPSDPPVKAWVYLWARPEEMETRAQHMNAIPLRPDGVLEWNR